MLESLSLCSVVASFRALERLDVPPYKGSTFRGAFGHTFRKVSCPIICNSPSSCLLRYRCAYSVCFETPVPPDATIMRKYPFAPHPFVLIPPMDLRTEYGVNDEFSVRLTLIGRGCDYLPHFIYAMDELGRQGIGRERGQVELLSIHDAAEEKSTLFERGDTDVRNEAKTVTHADVLQRCEEIRERPLTMVFETPTRVKSADKFLRAPDFAAMFPSLMRRCHSLAYFHCSARTEPDVHALLNLARGIDGQPEEVKWVPWERYSSRQRQRMSMDGFTGMLKLPPVPDALLPHLVWGESLHIGKGSAFGMGKYRLESR